MTVDETNLPGVGKKFTLNIDDDRELKIVIHNTGKREVYLKEGPDEDSEKLFELSDKLARIVGTILEGSYFQPVSTEKTETKLDNESVLEWVDVCVGSPIAGKKIRELEILDETGVSIIAIRRKNKTITDLTPDMEIEKGDKLIVVEPEEGHEKLREICEG